LNHCDDGGANIGNNRRKVLTWTTDLTSLYTGFGQDGEPAADADLEDPPRWAAINGDADIARCGQARSAATGQGHTLEGHLIPRGASRDGPPKSRAIGRSARGQTARGFRAAHCRRPRRRGYTRPRDRRSRSSSAPASGLCRQRGCGGGRTARLGVASGAVRGRRFRQPASVAATRAG